MLDNRKVLYSFGTSNYQLALIRAALAYKGLDEDKLEEQLKSKISQLKQDNHLKSNELMNTLYGILDYTPVESVIQLAGENKGNESKLEGTKIKQLANDIYDKGITVGKSLGPKKFYVNGKDLLEAIRKFTLEDTVNTNDLKDLNMAIVDNFLLNNEVVENMSIGQLEENIKRRFLYELVQLYIEPTVVHSPEIIEIIRPVNNKNISAEEIEKIWNYLANNNKFEKPDLFGGVGLNIKG